ncbi:MAG: hypothetical protein HN739_14040 [Gammaproteobacteria bacterium]|nr:hypothetical protein [Gammaproteobacteria bacterium]
MDSVHQGDQDKRKGVYHVNAVDEVTQFQIIVTLERISEEFMLEKLHIEFTKSRPRHSNDNGLVESKNGSVIRKLYGYTHIPQQYAADFTELNSQQVYRYVNFHRPCYFPSIITDSKGKQRKKYHYRDMMTPYEKFRSLPKPSQYLKPGIRLKALDAFANEMTDNEAAEQLNSAQDHLFKQLHERLKIRA